MQDYISPKNRQLTVEHCVHIVFQFCQHRRLNHCLWPCHQDRSAFYTPRPTSNTSKVCKVNHDLSRHGRRHCIRHVKQLQPSTHRNCHCIGLDRSPRRNQKIQSTLCGIYAITWWSILSPYRDQTTKRRINSFISHLFFWKYFSVSLTFLLSSKYWSKSLVCIWIAMLLLVITK